MTLELAILRMCRLDSIADLGDLIERLESGKGALPAGGRPSSPPGERAEAQSPGPGPAEAPGDPSGQGGPGGSSGGGGPPGGDGPSAVARGADPASAVRSPWKTEEVGRVWAEAVDSLRPSQRELLKDAGVDMAAEGRIVISLTSDNGHAQAFEIIQEALPALEAYFGEKAPWPARVVLEKTKAPPPPAPADSVSAGERKLKKETEDKFIQEVIDIFNGNISNIRPIRGGGGRKMGER